MPYPSVSVPRGKLKPLPSWSSKSFTGFSGFVGDFLFSPLGNIEFREEAAGANWDRPSVAGSDVPKLKPEVATLKFEEMVQAIGIYTLEYIL